jgi:hypothetical protein
MYVGLVRQGPGAHRRRCWPMFVAGLVAAGLVAGVGASWNRQHSVNVSINDAIRLLRTAQTPAEREQAQGAIAREIRNLCDVLGGEAKNGDVYAPIHLARIADHLAEVRK